MTLSPRPICTADTMQCPPRVRAVNGIKAIITGVDLASSAILACSALSGRSSSQAVVLDNIVFYMKISTFMGEMHQAVSRWCGVENEQDHRTASYALELVESLMDGSSRQRPYLQLQRGEGGNVSSGFPG